MSEVLTTREDDETAVHAGHRSNNDDFVRLVTSCSNFTTPRAVDEPVDDALHQDTTRQKATPSRLEREIVRKYRGEMPLRALAEELGVNRSVIRCVLAKYGVALLGPVLGDDRVLEVQRLYESGLSTAAVAQKLGVTKSTLMRFMHRNEFEMRDNHGRRAA